MSLLPLVSVVVPVYNSERFLAETIHSVKRQTYSNWELVLVDDCSTDGSLRMIRDAMLDDSRIRLVQLQKNSGALAARNTGIQHAKGRFLCFLDSDDTYEPSKIRTQVDFMIREGHPVSFTMFQRITESGEFLGNANVNFTPRITYKNLLGNPQFSIITLMVDRDQVPVPVLNYPVVRAEDYVFHLGILKQGFIAFGINEALSNYRFRLGSQSTSFFGNASDLWKVLFKIEKLGLLRSVFYFLRYLKNGLKKRLILALQLSSGKK